MNWPYTTIMIAAVGAAALLTRRQQSSLKLQPGQRFGIGLGAFCGAMLGAKLPFALSDWPGFLSGAAWFSDGKTILCGLVGGYLGVEIAKWTMEIRVKTGDTFAVPVAVAVAIGRVGCFVGGCCYGTPTDLPWGVNFGDGIKRHPTQLYETAFHLAMAAILLTLQRRGWWRGQLIKAYIIAYCVYRFTSETIRPEARLWWGLTGYQWASLCLIPLFAWLWYRDTRGDATTHKMPNRVETAAVGQGSP